MDKKPMFSVVIALYNKEHYIENTINSVLKQTFKDFEIIIINDGSTDSSLQIVKAINDKRIHVFSIENKGVSYARNFGIKKANAEYIALLDADDLWHKTHLEVTLNLLKDFPNAGMYSTGYNTLFKNKKTKKSKLKGISSKYRGIIKNYFESNLFSPIIHSSVVVIPKRIFNHIGVFDTDMRSGQDTYLWTQIALKHQVAVDNITTVSILRNEKSLSNSHHVKDRLLFLDKFIEQEKTDENLKKFMDSNRYSIALNYKLKKKKEISNIIYKNIDLKNINWKQKIIFTLPLRLLKITYLAKKKLDQNGIFLHLFR